MEKLTQGEMNNYAEQIALYMSDEDRAEFLRRPALWREGLEWAPAAIRGNGDRVFLTGDDVDWKRMRKAIASAIRRVCALAGCDILLIPRFTSRTIAG